MLSSVTNFIKSLRRMVDEDDCPIKWTQGDYRGVTCSYILYWKKWGCISDGKSIVVPISSEDRKYLLRYFKTDKLESFKRNLLLYGFTRWSYNPRDNTSIYCNVYFGREHRHMMSLIEREKTKSRRTRRPAKINQLDDDNDAILCLSEQTTSFPEEESTFNEPPSLVVSGGSFLPLSHHTNLTHFHHIRLNLLPPLTKSINWDLLIMMSFYASLRNQSLSQKRRVRWTTHRPWW